MSVRHVGLLAIAAFALAGLVMSATAAAPTERKAEQADLSSPRESQLLNSTLGTIHQGSRPFPRTAVEVLNHIGGESRALAVKDDLSRVLYSEGPRVREYDIDTSLPSSRSEPLPGLVGRIVDTPRAVLATYSPDEGIGGVDSGVAVLSPTALEPIQLLPGPALDVAVVGQRVAVAAASYVDLYEWQGAGLRRVLRYGHPAREVEAAGTLLLSATYAPRAPFHEIELVSIDGATPIKIAGLSLDIDSVEALVADGSTAYVATRTEMLILDIGVGDELRLRSRIQVRNGIEHLALNDEVVTLANRSAVGSLIDVSDLANPSLIAELDFVEPPTGLFGQDDLLAATSLSGGLYLYRMGLPALPSLETSIAGLGNLKDIAYVPPEPASAAERSGDSASVSRTLAQEGISNQSSGHLWLAGDRGVIALSVDDFSISAEFRQLQAAGVAPQAGSHVFSVGALLLDASPVDLSSGGVSPSARPAPPRFLVGELQGGDTLELSGSPIVVSDATRIRRLDRYFLLGTARAGLQVLNPLELAGSVAAPDGLLPTGGEVTDWASDNDTLQVVSTDDILYVASLESFPRLQELGTYSLSGEPQGVAAQDGLSFVAVAAGTGRGTIQVLSLADPSLPSEVFSQSVAFRPKGISVDDGTLTVVGGFPDGVVALFHAPRNGELLPMATMSIPSEVQRVTAGDDRIFIASRAAGVYELGLVNGRPVVFLPSLQIRGPR